MYTVFYHKLAALWTPLIQLPDQYSGRLSHLFSLLEEYHVIATTAWYAGGYCILVLMPYYAIVSQYAGTHTYQFAYVLSAIYISGVTPFVIETFLLSIMLLVVYAAFIMRNKARSTTASPLACRDQQASSMWKNRLYVWVLFSISNFTIVLGANVAFVYVMLYQSSDMQTLAQILLSVFKLGWSSLVAPYMVAKIRNYFISPSIDGRKETFFTLQLLVALFNNIAIPCMVVAAIDPNCFSNILLPPDTETVEYFAPQCIPFIKEDVCLVYSFQPMTLEFTPPFLYTYQCSASMITSYAPTFVYTSISTIFLTPLLQYLSVYMYEQYPAGTIIHWIAYMVIPSILILPTTDVNRTSGAGASIFRSVGTMVTLLTQLGVLLTFGVMFPPVALTVAVSLSVLVALTAHNARRFVLYVVEHGYDGYIDIINTECASLGTAEQMQIAQVILLCYCCCFYAIFLFDTLGDKVGFADSFWVLIVVPLLPLVLYGCFELHRRYPLLVPQKATYADKKMVAAELEVGIELNPVVQSTQETPQTDDVKEVVVQVGDNDTIVNVLHASSA